MSFCFDALRSSTLFNKIILQNLEKEGFADLTPGLLGIFAFLFESGAQSITTLSREMGTSRQAAHKSITKLSTSGYLCVQSRPDNKKERIVTLSERGTELVEHANRVINATEQKMAETLGPDAYADYRQKQARLVTLLEALGASSKA
jgi:DNA-binding MarR family transcriptional regulator